MLRAENQDVTNSALPHIPLNQRRVLLLMIDGLAVAPFEAALTEGHMPALGRLLQARPSVVMRAISTFPSATSPSVPELLSGRFANGDGIAVPAAVHAFDREQRRVIRYVTQPDAWQWPLPTLFDAARGRIAVTVFEGRWDGPTAILTQFNLLGRAALEMMGAETLSSGDSAPVQAFLQTLRGKNPPSVSLVVLNEFDLAAHFYGPESARARVALTDSDQHIGEIIDALAAQPGHGGGSMLDETALVLFGDHGMVPSGEFVDLPAFLVRQGMSAVDVSTLSHLMLRERLGTLWTEWPDVIVVSGGSNIAQIYLRAANGSWSDATQPLDVEAGRKQQYPSPEALAALLAGLQGVSQVMWLDDEGGIRIRDCSDLSARVIERTVDGEQRFAYVLPDAQAGDPFAYLEREQSAALVCRDAQLDQACFYSRTRWFDATYRGRFPGAVGLLNKAFHPQRYRGDLMVSLLPGYSFIRGQHGDHGNLEREAVMTPLILNGPGVQPRRESHQPRLVDIYPTVAVLLGADAQDPAFAHLDGRVLDSVR